MEKKLYRILSFAHVIEIFETNTLHFSKPTLWDDPYETLITNDRIFAQCWSKKGMSDAMWRIYSKDNLGIRIRTTKGKIESILKAEKHRTGIDYRIDDVKYRDINIINERYKSIKNKLKTSMDLKTCTESLYYKRKPFIHESEIRIAIMTPDHLSPKPEENLKIQIEPHSLIDKIVIDPRAPDQLANALIFYFKERIKFKGSCMKSILYKRPQDHEEN